MLAATLLTLLFVPVFYAVIESWRERGHEKDSSHAPEPGHVPAE
jgi:HAE1 family hydrophobic/amphiphilic exporter-1